MRAIEFSRAVLSVAVATALIGDAHANEIEEVTVTAQKRAESAQDVPIAISAFSGDQLDSLGTANLQELTEHIAGAELFDDRGAGQPTWVIRGVGLADFNSNNTPTAAIYYDEQYLSSNVLGGIGMFDIERVEVLKGPQGGLYGRNTSGGAVRVVSARPELEGDFNASVTTSYGSWGKSTLEAAAGGSLGASSAFRIAAMTDQGGGWQDSLATPGDDEHGDRDFSAVRAQLLFAPTDQLEVLLKLEGGRDDSETSLGLARALYDPETGDFCQSAWQGRADSNQCATLANLTNAWILSPGNPGLLPSQQERDGSAVLSNPINALDNAWSGFNGQLNWDLGFATFTSISAFLEYENNQIFDFDGQPLRLLHEDGRADLESWSQEFRLVSNSQGNSTWLLGATYAEDTIDEFRIADLSDNWLVFPGTTERGFAQESKSWAVYGQWEQSFAENWRFSSSLRYTAEDRALRDAYHYDRIGEFAYIAGVDKDYELTANWSGHVGVDWQPSDNALIYAKATKGFKSGGFFGGFAFTADELESYSEETVWSYEMGFKSDWRERSLRLNGAVFYYDYRDVQGFTQAYSETIGGPITRLGNLGDAEHLGAELEVVWLPQSVDGLSLQLGTAWLDATITDSDTIALDPAGRPSSIDGMPRNFAPEWSTSAQARYEFALNADLLAALQLNYSWRDALSARENFNSDLDFAAYGYEGYQVVNARLSLLPSDDRWEVALVGKNLTDEVYFASVTGDDVGSYLEIPTRPLSWAIEASYRWQ
ncbi:iron complex outermembrane recepter protein [Microbulbifer donghaiensis]|uniref:Iron complex outermembrane recepter protein n=1 Tax=Microbulbifer donghaiensis TaxID=494016 RepID=A0A1M4XX86_9GAMM|nr:TonB-dependent receptor [Microbulbifer donghaiensis]SHE98055.1 iron complex outermembrane recepter protein [Microbulbifer donghaiensis]